ncbi:hypothetical protein GOP47_0030243 [Adiantum capillus-veneris]|nr:hypothetical protein GOP47_0030243 [Adiantum capillus-veneris]
MLAGPHAPTRRAAVRGFSNLASLSYSSSGKFHNISSSTIIKSLCEKGHLDEALESLLCTPRNPPLDAYLALLKACITRQSLPITLLVYTHLTLQVSNFQCVLGDYLVVALAKCGAIDDACRTSYTLPRRTVFSWTAVISACVDGGRAQDALKMHVLMKDDGVEPNEFTYASLLKACGILRDLQTGKQLHDDVRKKGFASFYFVGNTLVSMYGKCGAIVDAVEAFISLPQHGVVAWNALLAAYVEQGQGEDTLQLYRTMQELQVDPDPLSLMSALQACGILVEKGGDSPVEAHATRAICQEIVQALHSNARKKGFLTNRYLATTLVCMYGKVGTIEEAENVFMTMRVYTIVSWNAMLLAYIEQGKGKRALQFYRLMLEEKMDPDHHTIATALKACYLVADEEEPSDMEATCLKEFYLEVGKAIYNDAQKKGMASDLFIGTSLLLVYGRCGATFEAERLLGSLPYRNVVSWTAMLSVYLAGGQAAKALQSYGYMIVEGVNPDQQALACSETGNLTLCQQLHMAVVAAGHDLNVLLTTTFVHAYGRCACTVDGQALFEGLALSHLASWTACIVGLAGKGCSIDSMMLFEELRNAGVKLDGSIFTSVFAACSHAGLVLEGIELFASMTRDYDVNLDATHYCNMVDLLGRAGDFKRLEDLLWRMPMQADSSIWTSLLGACRAHGNLELGKEAFCHALQFRPEDGSMYVIMSNLFSDGVRDLMQSNDKNIPELFMRGYRPGKSVQLTAIPAWTMFKKKRPFDPARWVTVMDETCVTIRSIYCDDTGWSYYTCHFSDIGL